MSRRVSLPGASELFRDTKSAQPVVDRTMVDRQAVDRQALDRQAADRQALDRQALDRQAADRQAADRQAAARSKSLGSGRVRHEEKITVYVSGDELLALEQARLNLRARHGMAVDRGRIVRVAIAAALAELEANGGESDVVRRLSSS